MSMNWKAMFGNSASKHSTPASSPKASAARLKTAATIAPLMVAFTSATAPAAVAQSSQTALYDALAPALAGSSRNPQMSQDINNLFQFIHTYVPGQQFPLWNLWGSQTPYTVDKERDFVAPRLVKREKDERFDVERLYIESPAMRRIVQVQVQYPKDRVTPAPMLYLLDGVSAPAQSGWLRKGNVQGALANEHVTAIMPVEAGGTNYTDWQTTDPYLGRSMWETFLTQELPGVLEAASTGIAFNGQRFIGGLSMGGSAAARIANKHPQLYAGAFSISGCYSPVNTSGREFFNLITRAMGGNPDLNWGTDARRRRDDVVAHPAGLATMPTYFYSADGVALQDDIDFAREDGVDGLFGNIVLEKVVNRCTHELQDSMVSKGLAAKASFDFHAGGVHEWPAYKRQLPVAWAAVSGGRFTYK